jgi:thiol:disulfide interchange protein DsbD
MMRSSLNHAFAIAVVFSVAAAACRAESAEQGDTEAGADLVQASLLADAAAVAPGTSFTLGVRLKMKPHWHTYWVNPGEAGDATKVSLKGPAGFEFGEVRWPLPSKIEAPGGVAYGYEDEVLLMVPVTVARDVPAGGEAEIAADVSWLVCKDTCIEGAAKLTLALPVAAAGQPVVAENQEWFDAWRGRLPDSKYEAAAGDAAAGAAGAVSAVDQPAGGDGRPGNEVVVHWKTEPRKVEWFPVATRAVSVDHVVVEHEGRTTRITFEPTVYQPEQVPGGRVESVLVYEDAQGRRRGITVPVGVAVDGEKSK